MDFIIIYERKQRELENAILLKIELEKRGYTCDIFQYYEGYKYNIFNINPPKVILVPNMYGSPNVYRTFSRYGKANHLVNLQYEQVLSEKWEKLGQHIPKNEARKAIHICWSNKIKDRLEDGGVPVDNLKVLGALHLDLLRKEYRRSSTDLKNQLGNMFDLDITKKWTLILSNFSYANMDDYRLKLNEANANTNLESLREIHTDSRNKILDWFKKILEKDKNDLIIYRPHPDELNLNPVLELEKMYKNFRLIRYSTSKDWIESSDNIYSWYSTSVIEAHFLEKPYSILRPITLPSEYDSVILKHAKFITEYNKFEEDYFKDDAIRGAAVDNYYVNQYYQVDKIDPAYKIYCDFLEKTYTAKKQHYNLNIKNKIIAKLKSISVIFVYFLYKISKIDLDKYRKENLKRNFFIEWFIEMDNQIASTDEKKEIEKRLKDIVNKQENILSKKLDESDK